MTEPPITTVLPKPAKEKSSSYAAPNHELSNYSFEITRRPIDISPSNRGYNLSPTKENTLTVGRNIFLSGKVSSCQTLVVEGLVEANLHNCVKLDITSTGTLKGDATVELASISGTFYGNLIVRQRLVVHKNAKIEGTIVYNELEVEPGATIQGSINPEKQNT